MALGKDRKRFNVKGGGDLRVREIYPTPTDAFSILGILLSNTFMDESTMVEGQDEKGDMQNVEPGSRKVTWVTRLRQSTKDEIDFIRGVVGKYYDVYYKVPLSNAEIQEIRLFCVRIVPNFTLNFAAGTPRDIEVTIHALVSKGAFTQSPAGWGDIAEGDYYVIEENAVALGPPDDTAANLATAVL